MKYVLKFILGFLFLFILLLIYVTIPLLLKLQESDFQNDVLKLTKYVEPLILLGGVVLIYRFQRIKNPLIPLSPKIFLIGVFLTVFVDFLIELTVFQFEDSTKFFTLNTDYNFALIPFYFIGIVLAALLEELVFRHYFFVTIGKAIKNNKILFILFSSILFTLMHFQYYDKHSSLISIFLFGVLYAYLFIEYENVWMPLGVHAGHNLFIYLLGRDIVNLTSNNSILYGNYEPLFTAIEILAIIFLIKKISPIPYKKQCLNLS